MDMTLPEMSLQAKARLTGAFFLLTILLGGAGESVSGRFIMPGDAAATASNVLAHATLWRLGFAAYLTEMACNIVVTALFYDLLKPVSRSASLLAAFFSLVGIVIKTFSRLFYLAPFMILTGGDYLTAFNEGQRQGLTLLLLRMNARGAGIGLVFFGFYALLQGYLIFRSTFLPRALGVLGMLGGLGWLTFMVPPLATRLYPYVVTIGLLGAAALIVWLLVFGVREQEWKEQARQSAASMWA